MKIKDPTAATKTWSSQTNKCFKVRQISKSVCQTAKITFLKDERKLFLVFSFSLFSPSPQSLVITLLVCVSVSLVALDST